MSSMQGAAPSSRLMQSIRAGFQQQGSFGFTHSSIQTDQTATPPVVAPATTTPVQPSLQDSLTVLDQVLTEVEAARVEQPQPIIEPVSAAQSNYDPAAQVLPQVIDQATDTLNPPSTGYAQPTAKETIGASQPVETAASIQVVETEKTPEIPVEVESYIQRVESQADQLPAEIVIADVTQVPLASHYAKQPVIVLPLTPEVEAAGAKKSPTQSIRWLVEFSRKIMKMFAGKVVYREAPSQ